MEVTIYYPVVMFSTDGFSENSVVVGNVVSFTESWNNKVNDMCLFLYDKDNKVMGTFWNYYGFTFLPEETE